MRTGDCYSIRGLFLPPRWRWRRGVVRAAEAGSAPTATTLHTIDTSTYKPGPRDGAFSSFLQTNPSEPHSSTRHVQMLLLAAVLVVLVAAWVVFSTTRQTRKSCLASLGCVSLHARGQNPRSTHPHAPFARSLTVGLFFGLHSPFSLPFCWGVVGTATRPCRGSDVRNLRRLAQVAATFSKSCWNAERPGPTSSHSPYSLDRQIERKSSCDRARMLELGEEEGGREARTAAE